MTICYPPSTDWACADAAYVAGLSQEVKDRSEALAWSVLAALTAYQMAPCPIRVRPCKRSCVERTWDSAPLFAGSTNSGSFNPHIDVSGSWINSCGCGGDPCSCTRIREIQLSGPVGAIEDVYINGVALPQTAYRVDNFDRLVRTDGEDWPDCQDMNLPATEENTFEVVYYRGAAPDQLTNYAAGVLALEFSYACNGTKCRLPQGVTSITRQGVSMEIQTGMFPNGYTGIREVDAVIMLYNPHALKGPSVVASPDFRQGRMVTVGRGGLPSLPTYPEP